ncbi:bifunctional D-glycero-beta-D-manno-heptose-7-phosphate kinase/D-glycero-beta-D-manno-heptose 1-phosphate adenylyltransferase HldE [Pseudomonadota bacterium]
MAVDIPEFDQARILVVGDVMLDRYWHGSTHRISPEAPVPVVHVGENEERPGGAGNVALNIAVLGGQVTLMGLVGEDEPGRALDSSLTKAGVKCCLEQLPQFPTITKLRVVSRHQQLIRMDFEDGFPGVDSSKLLLEFEKQLKSHDLVVLSDYGKGTLRNIGEYIKRARAAGKPVLVDPKLKDFTHYKGATLITPNMQEFEAVVGSCDSDETVVERGQALLEQHDLQALLITRGEKGMTLLQRQAEPRHLPTHAREVFDVTGAGDTVISALAAGLAAGLPLESATQLSNLAAGIVVGKLGTASVTVDELKWALHEHQVVHRGVVTEEQLIEAMATCQARGERIVFTNGCFDILHAGHVTYLEQASRMGDRLIVAVNVDETVRALKGADRPVNTLERRMIVLAALACVDWVVPFSEETPERLICNLLPDYLIKGGDNNPDDIPGARCVREAGGEVLVMEYVDNCSTTGLIAEIRDRDKS